MHPPIVPEHMTGLRSMIETSSVASAIPRAQFNWTCSGWTWTMHSSSRSSAYLAVPTEILMTEWISQDTFQHPVESGPLLWAGQRLAHSHRLPKLGTFSKQVNCTYCMSSRKEVHGRQQARFMELFNSLWPFVWKQCGSGTHIEITSNWNLQQSLTQYSCITKSKWHKAHVFIIELAVICNI